MSVVIHARVVEQLTRLRLGYVAERLDAVLSDAARTEPTYLDFLDGVLRQEVDAKQRTRVAMGLKIAHFPTVKTLDDFDFKFQPSVDQRLVRELATARFLAQAENVLIFGAPGPATYCYTWLSFRKHWLLVVGGVSLRKAYAVFDRRHRPAHDVRRERLTRDLPR